MEPKFVDNIDKFQVSLIPLKEWFFSPFPSHGLPRKDTGMLYEDMPLELVENAKYVGMTINSDI